MKHLGMCLLTSIVESPFRNQEKVNHMLEIT